MKIGKPVFRQMNASAPDYISSDCALAAMHIEQGIRLTQDNPMPAVKVHPLSLFRMAYGLPADGTAANFRTRDEARE